MIQPDTQSGLPAAPRWPDFPGPRVFAYLRPMPQLMEILKGLSARRVPTLAVVEEMNRASLAEQLGPNITLLDHPVDLSQVTRECDLAIHYAGHGTVCRFLLAGVPQLLIPIAVEQGLNSHRVKQLGAGLYTAQGDPEGVDAPLSKMLNDLSAYPGARAFREKYRTWDQQASVEELFRILSESC
jgi:glycosyltransferase